MSTPTNHKDLIHHSRQRLVAYLHDKLSSQKQKPEKLPPNSWIKLAFGGICAAASAYLGGDAATMIQQFLFSFGIELQANWYANYVDAQRQKNERREEELLDEAIAKAEVRAALHDLFAAYNLEAIIRDELQIALGKWFEKIRLPLPPIEASDDERTKFIEQVREVFEWQDMEVREHPQVDLLVTEHRRFGAPHRVLVKCVLTQQGRADEKMLAGIWGVLDGASRSRTAESGLIVSNHGLSQEAHRQAVQAGWEVQRHHELLAGVMNFAKYHRYLIDDFEKRSDPQMPAIGEYYVDLLATHKPETEENRFDLMEEVLRWINSDETQPLMLIGEYGTGKTTFARRLAANLAHECENFRNAKEKTGPRPRLPMLIDLKQFIGAQKIQALLTDHLAHTCEVANPKFHLFQAMNASGLFVIILDGFDEMALRVDSDTIEYNLKEIERLLAPRAKLLLTGRREFFMSGKEMREALWPQEKMLLLRQRFQAYRPLWLTLWDDGQVVDFLQKIIPRLPGPEKDWQACKDKIDQLRGINELKPRAVLLDMIAKTIPEFEAEQKPFNRPNLYELYLKQELDRQESKLGKGRKLLIDRDIRFALLQQLACQSYELPEGGITFEAAQPLVKNHLVKKDLPAAELTADKVAQNTRDFLTNSFLRAAPNEVFVFSHRSFRGYFAAKELRARLLDGTAKPQPIDQDCIDFLAEMMAETYARDWYCAQVEAALKKDGLPGWIKKKGDGYFFELPGGFPVEMVYVPAGPFVLGAEGDWKLAPQISILEKGFWMDKAPVTVEQFREFVNATKYVTEAERSGGGWTLRGTKWQQVEKATWRDPFALGSKIEDLLQHPVTQVSWNDARKFCEWAGKVLPGERQWEKASRGIDGRTYPWGNNWNLKNCNSASYWADRDLLDYEKDWKPWWEKEYPKKFAGQPMTTAVTEFEKIESPYGCLDSAGNVWEWCEDFFDEKKDTRVLRGGSWSDFPLSLRCAVRIRYYPTFRYSYVGFRCVQGGFVKL
jgi:formylglycine-generating enzyme required for sulfatase activity